MTTTSKNPLKTWLKYLAALALAIATPIFASDTLHDAINLHNHGVSDAVLVEWASHQPPIDLSRDNLVLLTNAGMSKAVLQALILGNTVKAKVAVTAPAQTDDTQIGPAQDAATPDNYVTVPNDGYDATYDYADYGYYGNPWALGFGYWPYYYGNYWWNPGHNWHNGRTPHTGYVSGSAVRGSSGVNVRAAQNSSVQALPAHQEETESTMAVTRSAERQNAASVAANREVYRENAAAQTTHYTAPASHTYSGGYSSGRSYSGGYSGGHSYSYSGGGHSFGGGGGGGHRR